MALTVNVCSLKIINISLSLNGSQQINVYASTDKMFSYGNNYTI